MKMPADAGTSTKTYGSIDASTLKAAKDVGTYTWTFDGADPITLKEAKLSSWTLKDGSTPVAMSGTFLDTFAPTGGVIYPTFIPDEDKCIYTSIQAYAPSRGGNITVYFKMKEKTMYKKEELISKLLEAKILDPSDNNCLLIKTVFKYENVEEFYRDVDIDYYLDLTF